MELRTNMYVRTINRIDKLQAITNDVYGFKNGIIYKNQDLNKYIIKSSNNIIDLIEVGDYVNGMQVVEVKNNQVFTDDINWNEISDLETDMGRIIGYGYEKLPIDNIKSIVTKEQFKDSEYVVE